MDTAQGRGPGAGHGTGRGTGHGTGPGAVEAVVELRSGDGARLDALRNWCAGHGISVLPMAAGALVTGPTARFREAFGHGPVSPSGAEALPVPDELREAVRSVTVLPVPEPHSPDA
ncbi:hypothetical protein ACFV0O_33145 [Kitasatospora sp. NPDC059577]|uniref:hypothetical protein n=1 Tax=Kitasatospora sp. NPDC059577 TaxID=3346873 RepID=UPI0036CDE8D2